MQMQLELFGDCPSVTASPLVVGFCGAKGHGKDTAADVLRRSLGFSLLSFATGLRRTVALALRVNESYFTNPDTKEDIDTRTGKSRRYWLQWIGTEGFRTLWDDIWVDWWKREITDLGMPRVVATDIRFQNEFDAVKSFERSLMIRVVNPNKEDSGDKHASEAFYRTFDVDYEITNDGTVAELQQKTLAVVTTHFNIYPVETRPAVWENI